MASFTHPDTILDLLIKQQSNDQQTGLRLAFHPSLLRKISLSCDPYHFAAMTGDTALILHLAYGLGLAVGPPLPVAEFSADGPVSNSVTPWAKVLSVSPSEVALLSGHAQAAEVLQLVERGVPLEWHRDVHDRFPEGFKHKVRAQVDLLCSSGLLCALPGPARYHLITILAAQLCSTEVWGCLSSELRACCASAACSSPVPTTASAATNVSTCSSNSCSRMRSRKSTRAHASASGGDLLAVDPWEVLNPDMPGAGAGAGAGAGGSGSVSSAAARNRFQNSVLTSNVGQDHGSRSLSSSVSAETKLLLRLALNDTLVAASQVLLDPDSTHGSSRTAQLPQYQFRVGGPQTRRSRRLGLIGLISVGIGLIALSRRPQLSGYQLRRQVNTGVLNSILMAASVASVHVAMDLARACFLLRR